jgi:hypothetical protein
MSSSEQLLLKSLTSYFQKHAKHRDVLYKIVTGQYSISLRVIDWFITHYAKAMNILYWIDETKSPNGCIVEQMPSTAATLALYKKFHLYYEYRAQLKSYTKMYFDPFRRHERIEYVLDNKAPGGAARIIETTVGQLNFFRWALQNHVIDYIHQYLPQIEGHMSLHHAKRTEKSDVKDVQAKPPKVVVRQSVAKTCEAANSAAPKTSRKAGKLYITPPTTRQCQVRFD